MCVRSGTFIARTHLHINVNKKKECVVVVVCVLLLFLCVCVSARLCICGALESRGPSDATVCVRRRCSRTTISFSFSRTTLKNRYTRKRDRGVLSKITLSRKERGKPIDDATLATRPSRRRRTRANVRGSREPRRLNARTRGNVCAFFRECILLYTRRFGFGFTDSGDRFHPLSLSQNNRKKTHQRDTI